MMLLLAAAEWLRWVFNDQFRPWLLTLVAFGTAALGAWRVYRAYQQLATGKLGLKGEKYVGQYLQANLLPRGYHVIHDICIDDFNVDHVVIGPGGVFAVEVKTRSKPQRGDVRVTFVGERLLVNGQAPDRDPIVQARAGAKRIEEILGRYSGRDVRVRPVVIFPNWFVEPRPSGLATWVLNEKAFIGFIDREPQSLSREDSRMLAESLARYVRDKFDKA